MGRGRWLALASICVSALACGTPDIEGTPIRQRVVAEPADREEEEGTSSSSSKEPKTEPKKTDPKPEPSDAACTFDGKDDDCPSDRPNKYECKTAANQDAALKKGCVKEDPDEADDYDVCCP